MEQMAATAKCAIFAHHAIRSEILRYYFYGTTEADERLIECIATYVMGWLSGKIKEKMMKKIAKELPAILALGTVIGCLILFMIKG